MLLSRAGEDAARGTAPARLRMFQGAVRAHRPTCPAAREDDLVYQPLGIVDEGFIPDGMRSELHLIRAFGRPCWNRAARRKRAPKTFRETVIDAG
ncbi:hypothetical protein [Nocardia sp. R6R-6]|uniref:hypothetical protein n=1 Tax=Nocardia sp. R6R-6 TaxID=3459303 RepID=UPI00403DA218